MSRPIILEIQTRRAARLPDKARLIQKMPEGIDSLSAQVTGRPFRVLRIADLVAAERSLHALNQLIVDLYAHVPSDADGAA